MCREWGDPLKIERATERLGWWLSSFAIVLTLLLTAGMFFSIRLFIQLGQTRSLSLPSKIRGSCPYALVVLFDVVVAYQHFQVKRIRRHFAEREDIFR